MQSLGHYDVIEEIGRGGMGVVYRARDTKLGRDVAIKMLPDDFVRDSDRLARFQREARTLATLNHPNVSTIHELGRADDKHFLVMELVPGEDLSERLSRGPMPLDEALPLFRQITEALSAAHQQSIVHRDLKPANIKLTADGRVKVLDFGLAKPIEAEPARDSQSPTVTRSAGTAEGAILGTAAYMSPEQASGKTVDKRTDVWAFGCVLYEALTGRRAFSGATTLETIASVLENEPSWSALSAATPPALRALLERCLRKDPRRRLHDIADARVVIDDVTEGAEDATPTIPSQESSRIPWLVAALLVAAVAGALAWMLRPTANTDVLRLSIVAPEGTVFADAAPAVSPDGTHVAFVAKDDEGETALWVRSLASERARRLPGTEGAARPFWSPNSLHLGFFADGKLSRIELSGGAIQPLADVMGAAGGGTWSSSGIILFAPRGNSEIYRVVESGGPAEPVTVVGDAFTHAFPQFLPDGERFLYTVGGGPIEERGAWVGSIATETDPRYLGIRAQVAYGSGHVLYVEDGWLVAHSWDGSADELPGEPITVTEERIAPAGTNFGRFSANGGLLVYALQADSSQRRLVWYDRSGRELDGFGPAGRCQAPRLSPEGTRVAFDAPSSGGDRDIWIWELEANRPGRVTTDPETDRFPVWSPDGRSVVFASQRGDSDGPDDGLYRLDLATGDTELLLGALEDGVEIPKFPSGWTSDGRYIIYVKPRGRQAGVYETWALPLFGDRSPFPVARGEGNTGNGQVSPDGNWIAYTSLQDGGPYIAVQRFPEDTGSTTVSEGQGLHPRWRGDGRELYYLAPPGILMAVEIELGRTLQHSEARPLFETNALEYGPAMTPYDVTADGERFIFSERVESESRELRVIVNWEATLRR